MNKDMQLTREFLTPVSCFRFKLRSIHSFIELAGSLFGPEELLDVTKKTNKYYC
jgi:hypothetical protein